MAPAELAPRFDLSKGLGSSVRLNSGQRMPVFGLGVWQAEPGRATEEAVATALSIGYRSIDTAALYRNERDVGAAIRRAGIPRDELFVTTKLWNDDQGYETALRAFERSRSALGLDTIDLYLVHWPVSRRRLESWRALTHLARDGACRSVGVSNFTVAHLKELLEHSDLVPAVNQVEFSPFLYQSELLAFCRSHGIQLEAYAPLTRGRRLGDPTLARIAAMRGRTPAQVVLRWGLQHGVIEIPKSVRPERIRENAGALEFELSDEEMGRLDRLHEGYRTTWDPSHMA